MALPVGRAVALNAKQPFNLRLRTLLNLEGRTVLLFGESGHPTIQVNALVIRKFGITAPSQKISIQNWPHLLHLLLADPDFTIPQPANIILGAASYGMLLLEGIHRDTLTSPIALRTVFGWVVTGPVEEFINSQTAMTLNLCCDKQLPALLKIFWEFEEVRLSPVTSINDQICERLFVEEYRRTDSGRYVVRLPKQLDFPTNLGDSLTRAKRVSDSMQKRMANDLTLKSEY
ncbi:uncharacterized protein LOC122506793 [Leptopilina heterotoma]|uniref:uncharacterized protein LOC122506793 n=1 Tax=Leptopilina heterotoma TaxID=63436 RepID=UPI001CA81DDD|nr:uncharacterized protein LOC122506793 [Leptopilina heterotoma]